jgi:sortase A
VEEVSIVDQSDARVLEAGDGARLTLITCYPFDAVQHGTRQRYVVVAQREL